MHEITNWSLLATLVILVLRTTGLLNRRVCTNRKKLKSEMKKRERERKAIDEKSIADIVLRWEIKGAETFGRTIYYSSKA